MTFYRKNTNSHCTIPGLARIYQNAQPTFFAYNKQNPPLAHPDKFFKCCKYVKLWNNQNTK